MTKNYRYILFDWDGCLAKTLELWLSSYKEVFARFGLFPTDLEITSQVFGDWNGPLKVGIKADNIEQYTQQLLEVVNRKLEAVVLYDDARSVIQLLYENGKNMAILTSSKSSSILPAIKKLGLEKYFQFILTAEDVTKHKPDPEVIELAIEKLGAHKADTVIVGDSRSDLGAASNAGIDSVLFYPPDHGLFYNLETLNKFNPTKTVASFKELQQLFLR